MSLAFIYGTLLVGYGNHSVMQRGGGEFVCSAVLPDYEMFSFGMFPGVRPAQGAQVIGEVWDVKDLRPLDMLEGHPNFYLRTPVTVYEAIDGQMYPYSEGGKVLDVETYVPVGDYSSYPLVSSGSWRQRT